MKTLHIVTLKKFYLTGKAAYTYGGFRAYLDMLSPSFDRIYIVAPISRRQFDNPLEIDSGKFKVLPLPCYWNELQLLLLSPLIFLIVGFYLFNSQIVNPRIPDMTGLIGIFFSKVYGKPHFISIQADLHELLGNKDFTNLKGIPKAVLYIWLRFNLLLEHLLCRGSVCLPQGQKLFNRFEKISKSYLWTSTAIRSDFVTSRSPFLNYNRNEIRFLNIGRFCVQKNQRLCIDSIYRLAQLSNSHDIHLLISGKRDRKIFPSLESLSKDLNDRIPSLRIAISPPIASNPYGLMSTYDSFHFFFITSLWEGTPKVVVEAMARGLIVIAPRLGGLHRTIIDNYNGFMYSQYDSYFIADLLLDIVSKPTEQLLQISRNAIETSSSYTVEAQQLILNKAISSCQ